MELLGRLAAWLEAFDFLTHMCIYSRQPLQGRTLLCGGSSAGASDGAVLSLLC